MLPRDVMTHVIAMIDSRTVRALLGYNYDQCIQQRITPCSIEVPDAAFQQVIWQRYIGLIIIVYYTSTQTYVRIDFKPPHGVTMFIIWPQRGTYKTFVWNEHHTRAPFVLSCRPMFGHDFGLRRVTLMKE